MGKPKAPTPPPPPAPAPTVQDAQPAAEDTIRKQRKQSGYQKTILTGALTPNTGKKTVLG
jgi:hypothetical protein